MAFLDVLFGKVGDGGSFFCVVLALQSTNIQQRCVYQRPGLKPSGLDQWGFYRQMWDYKRSLPFQEWSWQLYIYIHTYYIILYIELHRYYYNIYIYVCYITYKVHLLRLPKGDIPWYPHNLYRFKNGGLSSFCFIHAKRVSALQSHWAPSYVCWSM